MNSEIDEPIDLIRVSLGKNVLVKCRNDREIRGKLHVSNFIILFQAYDPHMNLLLSDVEEKIIHREQEGEVIEKKSFGLLFLRGDLVTLIVPSNK